LRKHLKLYLFIISISLINVLKTSANNTSDSILIRYIDLRNSNGDIVIDKEKCFAIDFKVIDYFFKDLPDSIYVTYDLRVIRKDIASVQQPVLRTALIQKIPTKERKTKSDKETMFNTLKTINNICLFSIFISGFTILLLLLKWGCKNAFDFYKKTLVISIIIFILSLIKLIYNPYTTIYFDNANEFSVIINIDDINEFELKPMSYTKIIINRYKKQNIKIYKTLNKEIVEQMLFPSTYNLPEIIYNIRTKNSYHFKTGSYK